MDHSDKHCFLDIAQVFNELIKAYGDSPDSHDTATLRQPAAGLLSGLLRLLAALLPPVSEKAAGGAALILRRANAHLLLAIDKSGASAARKHLLIPLFSN
jgi:hypothetical protein